MINRLRQRASDEGGFTLIELLVVILIVGILAAIAIPAFLSQKSKANDSAAETQVQSAQTAAETFATENEGSYAGLGTTGGVVKLQEVEPTLKDTSSATLTAATGTATTYVVTSTAKTTNDTFTIERNGSGEFIRTCTASASNHGDCKITGSGTSGTW